VNDDAPRLRSLSWDELDAAQREVYTAIIGSRRVDPGQGRALPGPFNAMLHNPEIGGPLQRLGAAIRSTTSLSLRSREIATLAVAARLRSDYEWARHSPIARELGLTDAQLSMLHADGQPDLADPAEQTVLRTTRRLLEESDLSDQEFGEAIAAVGEAGLVALSTLVGYYRLLALQLRIFHVPV
jgi:4-carboxymuconolactone decarboxylase